jgi:acetoacetate decarboxylase
MRNGSFFIPREQIFPFFNPGEMNSQEGLYLCWETDPTIARRVLPPQLALLDREHPVATVYVVNIREPTFASWYMEAGLMLLCRYGETAGGYFLNLQLSDPGAAMGMCGGREISGLPKKICERIVVERTGESKTSVRRRVSASSVKPLSLSPWRCCSCSACCSPFLDCCSSRSIWG